jgi:hypothetical protein
MANHLAIAAVARTVLQLIQDHCPRDEFIGTPTFQLYSGQDFSTQPVNEGFSVLVYRLGVNGATRNQPGRRLADGRRRPPALPVDVSILLTPWSTEAERQLRLTGWVMRFLEDHAVLPASLLNQSLSQRDRPAFDAEESVELFFESPPLADFLGLWDKFRHRWQTSLTYGVRMLSIESELSFDPGRLVQERRFVLPTEVQDPAQDKRP